MKVLGTRLLVLVAAVILGFTWWFRPKGIEGPRPEPVTMEGKDFDHSAFTAVLEKVVGADGRINYAALRQDPGPLDRYLGQLRATSPRSAPHRFRTDEARLAYYINAFNAFMLAAIRDRCPVANAQQIYALDGLFWRVSFLLGEEVHSLNEIETDLLGEVRANQPAVRFAVVKAAQGYPALPQSAYAEGDVRARLAALSVQVAHDPRFVRREGTTLVVSQLFEWHLVEFGGDVIAWLKRTAPEVAEGATAVRYEPVDPALNGDCGS